MKTSMCHCHHETGMLQLGADGMFVSVACGGFFNSSAGTVSSPTLSMANYHHNINCTYHIMVQANRIMELRSVTSSKTSEPLSGREDEGSI